MSERETAAYAFLRSIDYVVEECPFARGATSLTHKEVLNRLEDVSPGSKASFFLGYLERARHLFQAAERVDLRECLRCGQTTTGEVCAFCKLADQVRRATGATPAIPPPAPESGDPATADPASLRGLISDLHAASEIHSR
jgi:uncharacterized protein (TIGR00269 family)